METNDEVVFLFKKILDSQNKSLKKPSITMQQINHTDTGKELTAERLLLRIMRLENTVQEMRQESSFKDREIKRLETQLRDWQQVTLKLQSRVTRRM